MSSEKLASGALLVVKQLCSLLNRSAALTTEGLFRLSADTEQMELWIGRLEQDPRTDLSSINDPNLLAHLLKRYLRLLSPPLLTYDLYAAFLEAVSADDAATINTKLCACVMKLPPLNYDILCEVLQLLRLVLEYEDKNRMGVDNLATVFTPCLISKPSPDGTRGMMDPTNLIEETKVVQNLIKCAPTILTVERVGAMPRDTGLSSSAFPGVRVLSSPMFSSSPVTARRANAPTTTPLSPSSPPSASGAAALNMSGRIGRSNNPQTAYARYDYRGSVGADTLTVARGDTVLVLEFADGGQGKIPRWCRCQHRESGDEGWLPTAFLDGADLPREPLGREKALQRAGSAAVTSPLRGALDASGALLSSRGEGKGPARTLEEMNDRLDILSRALVKEKEDRLLLERRIAALLSNEK